ncbi:MAG TPA: beta-L-arabinofuranosidase domain-containing protein [Capsulimonadaceae bacterium]|jgi:hypothetical protein
MSNNVSASQFSPVPFTRVVIDDVFWSPRIEANRNVTLPIEYGQLKSTGRLDALKLEWKTGMEPVPHIFWESDIAKWLEAASYSLASHPDPALEAMVDEAIGLIEHAQQPDGYINVHFTVVEPEKRWSNLRDWHELYCAGHLIEAAVAHSKATGSDRFLNIMRKFADYIGTVFGREPGQKRGYCGHEEIELALVKLARHTGERRYMELAKYFVDERGAKPHYYDQEAIARGEKPEGYWAKHYDYCQASMPVRELSKVAGHSVRAMYLYTAMADLAGEYGDTELSDACERLWNHLCLANMYITGGIGSSRHNEGFTADYDLPNETAYAETCAAIGLVYWNQRLLHLDLDGKYADIVERALYNGVISGVSLDGSKFFYENPLESRGAHHRQGWFGCACCPPNVARILASLGDYVYSEGPSGLAVNLYVAGSASAKVGSMPVALTQETRYPWDGAIRISVTPETPSSFDLSLRIPAWCKSYTLAVNDAPIDAKLTKGYAIVSRTWAAGDVVTLVLDMPVERVAAHPAVVADQGRVALQRGPVVYCLEDVDNEFGARRALLTENGEITATWDEGTLGGVVVLDADGVITSDAAWDGALYRSSPEPALKPVRVRAVPYAAWDNRAPGAMTVWVPVVSA